MDKSKDIKVTKDMIRKFESNNMPGYIESALCRKESDLHGKSGGK